MVRESFDATEETGIEIRHGVMTAAALSQNIFNLYGKPRASEFAEALNAHRCLTERGNLSAGNAERSACT